MIGPTAANNKAPSRTADAILSSTPAALAATNQAATPGAEVKVTAS